MTKGYVERVTAMTEELGFKTEVFPEKDVIRIEVPQDAPEPVLVLVGPCGEMHGKEVLEFSSRGLRLPDDDAGKMPLLILALQRNADVMLGHWGLEETPEGSVLRVYHAQITETMDLPELQGALTAVADEFQTLASAFVDLLDATSPS